jgi:hypothetical protein
MTDFPACSRRDVQAPHTGYVKRLLVRSYCKTYEFPAAAMLPITMREATSGHGQLAACVQSGWRWRARNLGRDYILANYDGSALHLHYHERHP